jgi:hypothetical protein
MPEYIFKGPLADNPLPEVLQKINYYKVPGVLTVASSHCTKHIFISGGEVIFASSTLEQDRLGEFLLARGRITPEQYDLSVVLMKKSGKRQGTVLVESGTLTPQELYQAVKEQVMAIVLSLFNWTEGEVTFKVGRYKDDEIIKLNLDTRNAILQGIKSVKEPKRVVKWLGRKEDVFEPTDHALAILPTLPLSADDKRVFRLVDGVRTFLGVLQASSTDATATAKILYALYILGLIKKKTGPGGGAYETPAADTTGG